MDYKPSPAGQIIHDNLARIRILIWGIKSGKTFLGCTETVKAASTMPGGWVWVVGPNQAHTTVSERVIHKFLLQLYGAALKYNQIKHHFVLPNGCWIEMKTGDLPNNLRGPNLDWLWIDEGAYLKDEAWYIAADRTAATKGQILITTTPNDRNWLWNECLLAGMPPSMDYGEWGDAKLDRFVSHYPTWHFPWVSKDYIAQAKKTRPAEMFDKDYGALFVSSANQTFSYIEESLNLVPLIKHPKDQFVLGLDLAKYQDFTALVTMDGRGYVHDVERWTGVDWGLQKERIKLKANTWKAVVVMDVSNIGSVIEEDLREMGLNIFPVNMNDARTKTDLIQALQLAFEGKRIHIPNPNAEWASPDVKYLIDELKIYTTKLTAGARLSYSAPKGSHDDLVISLALANWGKLRGLAGGGFQAADISLSKAEWEKNAKLDDMAKIKQPRVFKNVFGNRKSSMGWGGSSSSFWG